jgi:hypothetical protein
MSVALVDVLAVPVSDMLLRKVFEVVAAETVPTAIETEIVDTVPVGR